MNKKDKIDYIKRQKQDRPHHCHWPGCDKQVKPALWGCYPHWMRLPKYLRDKVWAAYRPGQEKDMRPSREYLAVAREVQHWIRDNYPDANDERNRLPVTPRRLQGPSPDRSERHPG